MIIYNHIYIYIHIFYMYYTNISNIHNGGIFQETSVFIVSSLFIQGRIPPNHWKSFTKQPQPTHLLFAFWIQPTNQPLLGATFWICPLPTVPTGSITALPTELKVRPFTHIMSVQAWVPLRKLCVGGLFRDFQKAETSAQKTGGCLCVWGNLFRRFQKGNPVEKTGGC